MEELHFVNAYLSDVINFENRNEDTDRNIANTLKGVKLNAVDRGDQDMAKMVWCYEQILKIQRNYLSAFNAMKTGDFYGAWCRLERIEIKLGFLEPHFLIDPTSDAYKLAYIEKHTIQFQSLYPYKFFLSPARLDHEKKCSICGRNISIRNPCEHKKGEIYNGEMCSHEITKADILEVSVVSNPVQKYSVLFLSDSETGDHKDHYDYSLVKFLISRLNSPFDAWEVRWTKIRHPDSLFADINRDDNCPCDSGKKYKNCCLRKDGILRPHVEFIFSVPPPDDLPRIVYPDYKTGGSS
jgi:hypothetical protein